MPDNADTGVTGSHEPHAGYSTPILYKSCILLAAELALSRPGHSDMTLCSCPESLEVCGAGKGVFLTTVVYERLAMAILGSVPRLGIVHGKLGDDGWRDHTADLILERSRGEESRLGRGPLSFMLRN